MPRFDLPEFHVEEAIEKKMTREYSGASFNVIQHPLGYWLCETYYSNRRKKSDAGQILESILRKAYNAGMLDRIKDIDAIAKRAFGNVLSAKIKAHKPRKARKSTRKAKANIALEGTA
jgi:hypothetical protein